MRVLIGPEGTTGDLGEERLASLYSPPRASWLRVNMVSTVDGAASGPDGRTGSINNAADKRVFDLLRSQADAVVVGAGTARTEGYGPVDRPIVVVSRRGEVSPRLAAGPPGSVLLVTCASAPRADRTAEVIGREHVLVCGDDAVDLAGMRASLAERGLRSLLSEGGPSLLTDLLAAGVVDELCCTVVPSLVGGMHPRITDGQPVDVPLELALLLEEGGTLLGRWLTRTP